jgi:hypothetical protein
MRAASLDRLGVETAFEVLARPERSRGRGGRSSILHLSRRRGLSIDAASVLVAPGAKAFLFFGVLATCGPG